MDVTGIILRKLCGTKRVLNCLLANLHLSYQGSTNRGILRYHNWALPEVFVDDIVEDFPT